MTESERIAEALRPFGWTCEYYTDAWVFNLASAVTALSERVRELEREKLEARA